MLTPLVITDLTRMQHGRVCLAGYRRNYRCVRPVLPFDGIMETWLFEDGRAIVRPFAVIEFDLLDAQPDPPHSEDWCFDAQHKVWLQDLTWEWQWKLLTRIKDPNVASIFDTEIEHEQGWFVAAGSGSRSLGTIRPQKNHEIYYTIRDDGQYRYALVFTDMAGVRYRLSVTDLAFRRYLDYLCHHHWMRESRAARLLCNTLSRAQVFLRIGLARGWDKHPDRCYLQITGVYSNPDYLEGRCFADFELPAVGPDTLADDDLPF